VGVESTPRLAEPWRRRVAAARPAAVAAAVAAIPARCVYSIRGSLRKPFYVKVRAGGVRCEDGVAPPAAAPT